MPASSDCWTASPDLVELGIFSVMWSEHCSYKSTRAHLKKLPTKAPWVIQGPGENAGVIDIGDGDAVIFKMESHNHPVLHRALSGRGDRRGRHHARRLHHGRAAHRDDERAALRRAGPSQDPASGVGRGRRASAAMAIAWACRRWAAKSISTAPTTATSWSTPCASGLARTDKIFLSAAKGAGNPVVYIGSKTGRDGIHGATMASAEFNEDSEEKRPTVQVGDPFTEKLLLEACLELMATDAIIAIQDMGAAGLTSSSAEMADKGGSGIELDLDKVPQREANMTAYEMMLSESQERMLAVLKPGREAEAEAHLQEMGTGFRRHRRHHRHQPPGRQAQGRDRRRHAGHGAVRRSAGLSSALSRAARRQRRALAFDAEAAGDATRC